MMSIGILLGAVSLWLAPISFSLTLAAPLSKLSALRISDRAPKPFHLHSPLSLREPRVVRSARAERAWMKALLAEPEKNLTAIAAE